MTDEERLEELIKQDKEFRSLYDEAINCVRGKPFYDNAKTILLDRLPDESAEKLFARFKITLGWSIMMSKVLQKIGDKKQAIRAADHTYTYTIVTDGSKPQIELDSDTVDKIITNDLEIKGRDNTKKVKIKFSLSYYRTPEIPDSNYFKPDLLNSSMTVRIYCHWKYINLNVCRIKDFNPDWLGRLIWAAAYKLDIK